MQRTGNICEWTDEMTMQLNHTKSKDMIFNKQFQFISRIHMNDELLEIVEESTMSGLVISNDLSWRENTDNLVTKTNIRIIIGRNLSEFPISRRTLS